MPAGDSYLYATLCCIVSDLAWIEKIIEGYGQQEPVEIKFTSLKKSKGILRARSCHLILLIRDKTKKIYNGSFNFPYKRVKILNSLPENFYTISAGNLKIYLKTIFSTHYEYIFSGTPEQCFYPEYFSKLKFKNRGVKLLVEEYTAKFPGCTKEEIFYKVAEQTEDSFDNIKRLYYYNLRKS